MRELGIVAALIALMLSLSAIWVTPWESLYRAGVWLTVAGFAIGLPTGAMYHVRLYQALHPRGELPRGWYWRPIQFNRRLSPAERSGVMAWCYVGGAGFGVICLGLLTMVAAIAIAIAVGTG